MALGDEVLELEIPPEAGYVAAARLFLGAAGRHLHLSEESLADVKVAVSEVCADATEDPTAGPLRITVRPNALGADIEVSGAEESGTGATGGAAAAAADGAPRTFSLEHSLREPLVRALFPEAEFNPRLHRLRISVPVEEPAGSS